VVLARLLIFDIRRIPTSSMAPTLIGADDGGDRVLVDRLTPRLRAPRRWEIAAFRHPLDGQRELVKRVAGLPQEKIRIVDGDLFVNGQRLRKSAEEIALVRIPLFRSDRRPLESAFEIDGRRVAAAPPHGARLRCVDVPGLDGAIVLAAPHVSTDGYEAEDGTLHRGENLVLDLQIETQVSFPKNSGSLVLELGDGGSRYLAVITKKNSGGASARILRAPAVAPEPIEGATAQSAECLATGDIPGWTGDETHRVTFTNFDCRVSLEVDGVEVVPPIDFDEHRPWTTTSPGPVIPRLRSLGIGAYGGEVLLRLVAVYRDIHFLSTGRFGARDAFQLGPQQYFVLGDHSGDSDDSRSFGAVERGQIVGLVRATVYPFSRARRFP
jgi:signal peptidase I